MSRSRQATENEMAWANDDQDDTDFDNRTGMSVKQARTLQARYDELKKRYDELKANEDRI